MPNRVSQACGPTASVRPRMGCVSPSLALSCSFSALSHRYRQTSERRPLVSKLFSQIGTPYIRPIVNNPQQTQTKVPRLPFQSNSARLTRPLPRPTPLPSFMNSPLLLPLMYPFPFHPPHLEAASSAFCRSLFLVSPSQSCALARLTHSSASPTHDATSTTPSPTGTCTP